MLSALATYPVLLILFLFQVTVDHYLQSDCSAYLALSLSTFSVCAVICLNVAWEVMTLYIEGGTILNTQDSDCLRILHMTLRLLSSSHCSSVSFLFLFIQIGHGSVTLWPTCSHKPISPKRLKDKLNLMPCNKLDRLLCTVRHCIS